MRALRALSVVAVISAALLAGCGKKTARAHVPPPPAPAPVPSSRTEDTTASAPAKGAPTPSTEPTWEAQYRNRKPIYSETGVASWYGTVYHHRKAANGEIYDQNGLTAAHKALPLNSVARVTNLSNGKDVIVRITDRGPFVGDRIIDLSVAAAKEIGSYGPGLANVRVDVLDSPKDIASGGRWCVQIGAFKSVDEAAELKDKLSRRYRTAKILQFTGPTGEWIRVRVLDDDKHRAAELAKDTKTSEGVFLVRLD
ncbi:MAG TPA: septal ring lytic transglycosylase RlpA family protein [Terriglobales bacterium]